MENKIQIFENKEFGKLRTVEMNKEPWFVGKDVAEMLGYSNTKDALAKHVDREDKKILKGSDLRPIENHIPKSALPVNFCYADIPNRGWTIINESGLYSLVISSKLPKAKQFKHWVTSDVLPTIRKNGMYMSQSVAQQVIDNPTEFLARAVLLANDQIEKLKLENSKLKPKAEFYDTVASTEDLMSMGDVAKLLDMGIGRNKLFAFLRNKGVLRPNNVPYQRYVDAGYFKLVESKVANGESTMVFTATFVKQRGIDYIRKLIKDEAKVAEGA